MPTANTNITQEPSPEGKTHKAVRERGTKRPTSMLDICCQMWFAAWVLVLTLTLRLLCGLVHTIPLIRKADAYRLSGCIAGLLFRTVLGVCPWMRIVYKPTVGSKKAMTLKEAILAAGGSTGTATVVMMNHASFIDSLVAMALLSQADCGEMRALMTASLFKIPIWGEMCRLMGHFSVFAISNSRAGTISDPLGNTTSHDDFRIDKKKQALVSKDVDTYIQNGGGVLIYPEGTINRQVRRGERVTSLAPFRYGGIAMAMRHKMKAVALVARGCEDVWPWGAKIGGIPGLVEVVAMPLNLDEKKEESPEEVSKRLHDKMEKEIIELYKTDRTHHAQVRTILGIPPSVCGLLLMVLLACMIVPMILFLFINVTCIAVAHVILYVPNLMLKKKGKKTEGKED
eukprot:jgi/Bigna1/66105/fgenesh1_pg.1_\